MMGLEAEGRERLYSLKELKIIAYRYYFLSKYSKNKTLLDVGCGSGIGFDYLFKKKTKSILGIDLDTSNIQEAEYNLSIINKKKTQFLVGDINKITISNKFDVICGMQVIQYIGLNKFIHFAKTHLKRKGTIILEIPNSGREDGFKKSRLGKYYYNSKELYDFFKNEKRGLVKVYSAFNINSNKNNSIKMAISSLLSKLPFGIRILALLRQKILNKQKIQPLTFNYMKSLGVNKIKCQEVLPNNIDTKKEILFLVYKW